MDIWTYYKAITRRLLAWSIVSVIAGAAFLFLSLTSVFSVDSVAFGLVYTASRNCT